MMHCPTNVKCVSKCPVMLLIKVFTVVYQNGMPYC